VFDRDVLGGWRSLERRRRQRLFDRVAVSGTMASACTTTPFLFFLLVFSGHFVCHDSLVPYTSDARPGYGAPSHAPPPSLRECLPSFHSCSTEAWPRTSPTGPALYGRAWFSRRLRVKITCKCLVTVPASFPSENVLTMVLRKPFSLRQIGTHPYHAVLHWTWFPDPRFHGRDLGVTASDISPSRKS